MPITPLDGQFGIHPAAFLPNEVSEALSFDSPSLYAIVDSARIEGLPELLEGRGVRHLSLYRGESAEALRGVAPYLVELDVDSPILRQLFIREAGKQHWWDLGAFVLLQSEASIDDVHTHLRRSLYIADEKKGVDIFDFGMPISCAT